MTKQLRYPVEAFALAMVLFSGGMKEAAIVGIGLIFAVVLQAVLREFFEKTEKRILSAVGAFIGVYAIYYMLIIVDIIPDTKQLVTLGALLVLLIKDDEKMTMLEEIDFNSLLLQGSVAYGFYLLFALIKEYAAGGKIFGFELPELGFISHAYGKTMLALFIAAIFVAVVNRVLRVETEYGSGILLGIAILLIEAPFVWNNVNEVLGTIVGSAFGLVIFITLRKRLLFANTEKNITGIPAELALLGIIYMVFSFL